MSVPSLLAFKAFQYKHRDFLTTGGLTTGGLTTGGLRHQIFHADKNGLGVSGAIIRMGRKILIDEAKYFAWIKAGQSK